jgi:hypothetical protein
MTARIGSDGIRALIAGLALVAVAIVGCLGPPNIGAAQAATIAEEFLASGQPSGWILGDISAGRPEDMGTVWRVKVNGLLRNPLAPGSEPGPIHAIIDVDKSSGAARMFAQG